MESHSGSLNIMVNGGIEENLKFTVRRKYHTTITTRQSKLTN